ncbi:MULTISPECIES: hypothetical protein [unclassified Nocardia]|uniref:hypothetical protein n=1 Tax=unclassified Nocardia TaxID=2637762 RepID=UPI00342912BB
MNVSAHTARDQLIHAAGIIADTTIDLIGTIGRAVWITTYRPDASEPAPAWSNAPSPNTAQRGHIDRNINKTEISVHILPS